MDASQPIYCSNCKQIRPAADFPTNHLGRRYKTCIRHRAGVARRQPLGELDVNTPRQTRSGSVLPITDDIHPLRRPRKRRRTRAKIAAAREAEDDPFGSPILPEVVIPAGYRSVYRQVEPHKVGEMDVQCTYCAALHWIDEAVADGQFKLCCKKGDAILENLRAPPGVLMRLLDHKDPRGPEFYKHIRSYNSALSFTSVSARKEDRIDTSRGIQTYTAHSALYHFQGPLEPASQETPAFAQ
ncbi:uncharacterized protein RAG0_12553 [Rhynchosporium agropyri]|uniref:Uncharacterized protein n=1 Tax=Rhynchosporium agropyri TaxID=914238 RepID=A0A1E1L8Z6_9HELO|nr:uncharacterized protein RAG0_12553 [Rhynchosporium agropyri]